MTGQKGERFFLIHRLDRRRTGKTQASCKKRAPPGKKGTTEKEKGQQRQEGRFLGTKSWGDGKEKRPSATLKGGGGLLKSGGNRGVEGTGC